MAINGGFYPYDRRVSKKLFFRADSTATGTVTVLSGQVLKALSFVETNADGKAIAHSGITESAIVTFATITAGQTLILAGLTFTAGSGSVTAAELVTIWKDLPAGITAANANLLLLARSISATVKGTFTAGTLAQYGTAVMDATDSVVFSGFQAFAALTDVADTGTATNPVVTLKANPSAIAPIAGILLYDVNASVGDVQAEVYKEGSFWADSLNWATDSTATTGEQMAKADGTTVAFTAYNTGLSGSTEATQLLRKKFVEGTEFEPLGFLTLGEIAND
jgi:S-layer protein